VGALVPLALRAVKKGGRVVCGGIHMSDIPSFPYRLLWEERHLVSVANLTRADAHEFLALVPQAGVKTEVTRYPLEAANDALADLRAGRLQGAAVLIPWCPPSAGVNAASRRGLGPRQRRLRVADHALDRGKAQAQCALHFVDLVVDVRDFEQRIDEAVEIDDLAVLGRTHAHVVDCPDEVDLV